MIANIASFNVFPTKNILFFFEFDNDESSFNDQF